MEAEISKLMVQALKQLGATGKAMLFAESINVFPEPNPQGITVQYNGIRFVVTVPSSLDVSTVASGMFDSSTMFKAFIERYVVVPTLVCCSDKMSSWYIPFDIQIFTQTLKQYSQARQSSMVTTAYRAPAVNIYNMNELELIAHVLTHHLLNPYHCFGVSTGQDIRQAYLFLSKKFHPDKCSNPLASQVFQAVQAAYEKLIRK